jgi:hypothetical protein
MAIDYFFDLTIEKSPQEFLQHTAQCFSLNWIDRSLTGSALLISAGNINSLALTISQEDLGISPTVSVLFNFNMSEYTEETYRLMIRICAHWLASEPGDAVLVESTAGYLFLRKSGILTIDTDIVAGWWKPERLDLMPEPWQRGNLPAY